MTQPRGALRTQRGRQQRLGFGKDKILKALMGNKFSNIGKIPLLLGRASASRTTRLIVQLGGEGGVSSLSAPLLTRCMCLTKTDGSTGQG